MRKALTLILLTFLTTNFANAQDEYSLSAGVRIGGGLNGGTIKYFMMDNIAVEGILAPRWGGMSITGLVEVHNDFFDIEHMRWFYGGGAHIGFYDGAKTTWGKLNESYFIAGLDGVIGVEYNFTDIIFPFTIGSDFKPAFNFNSDLGFQYFDVSVTARYIFK